MQNKRKVLSKRQRFEVFKRDSFTCQYCGKSAPDVVLEADHINPVSKGGTNRITNLITACHDCNSGKSDKVLSDDTQVKKQLSQLKLLQERKNQIEMVAQWAESLLNNDELEQINKMMSKINNTSLTELCKKNMRKRIKKYGFKKVIESMPGAYDRYKDDYIEKLDTYLKYASASEEDRHFMYSVGILRNRLEEMGEIIHYDPSKHNPMLKYLRSLGLSKESYRDLVLNFVDADYYYSEMKHRIWVYEIKKGIS